MRYAIPITNKPLAFSYVRMSTATQLQGDSLRRQTQSARKYADENGLFLVEDFRLEDIGVSAFRGTNAEKGVLAVFLTAVDNGDIPRGSYLLVESLDRLSRNDVWSAFGLFSNILKAGLFIVTLLDGQRYSPDDKDFQPLMMSLLQMTLAHQESQKKSERVGAAWKNKRANIAVKKLTARCPAWLKMSVDGSRYEPIHERVAVVRLIFDLALAGDGSYSIARDLNARGISTFGTGARWGKSSVTKILTNSAVYGEFQPHRLVEGRRVPEGDPVPEYFPVVIDQRDYILVQSGRHKREIGGKGRKGDSVSNLFTNLARCAYCKNPMHYVDKGSGPKGGKYLKCSRSISARECSPVSWRYEDFELSFLYFCRELDLSALALQTEKKRAKAIALENLKQSEALLSALYQRREKIFDLLETATTEYVSEKLAAIEAQIDVAKNEKRANEDLVASAGESEVVDEQDLIGFIETFKSTGSPDNLLQRKALRKTILASVEYLLLAPAGNAPIARQVHGLLLGSAEDDEDRQRIADYIAEAAPLSNEIDGPYFKVGLSGNIHRVVGVEAGSPTKLRALVTAENGAVSEYKGGRYSLDYVPESSFNW